MHLGRKGGSLRVWKGKEYGLGPTLTSLPLDWDAGGHADILAEGRVGSTGLGELVCVGR